MRQFAVASAAVLTLGLGALAGTAAAQPPAVSKGAIVAQRQMVTATVEQVDHKNRTVLLRGPEGNEVEIKVPPDAKNFDKIEPGDTVRAEYLESVAVSIRKKGEGMDNQPSETDSEAVDVTSDGATPIAMKVDREQITAEVISVDPKTRMVTLRGPQGGTRQIHVDPSVQGLERLKVGDDVVVTHTQAVGVSLDEE